MVLNVSRFLWGLGVVEPLGVFSPDWPELIEVALRNGSILYYFDSLSPQGFI